MLPGNKTFRAGDRIDKPPSGGGGRGRRGSPDGEAEDDFAFVLSRDEFLEIFFEDLELPDLVKRTPEGDQDQQAAARRASRSPGRPPTSTCRAPCATRSAAGWR